MDQKINVSPSSVQTKPWKPLLKIIGSIILMVLSIFVFYIHPLAGVGLFLLGLIWTLRSVWIIIGLIIRLVKNSKKFPIIKRRIIQGLSISFANCQTSNKPREN